MRTLTCTEVKESLPALALEALEEDERRDVHAHIDDCPGCREEFVAYAEVSRGLLGAVPQRVPPPAVKAGLMGRIQPRQRSWVEALGDWLRGAQALPRWAFSAALVVLLILVGVFGAQTVRLSNQLTVLAAQLQQQQLALASLASTNTAVMTMQGTTQATGAKATLRFDPEKTLAVFNAQSLPVLPQGQSYQLWLIDATGHRDSGAIFNMPAESNGWTTLVVVAPRPLKTYVRCGVSIEPRGGSPQPTGPAALTGKLWS